MLDKKYYITTPIYYVNAAPHVGSATTTLIADAFSRYRRLRGEPVFFLTGTDENAQKVANAAAKNNLSTQEHVDIYSQRFIDTWRFLNITNDDFIRTTEPRHAKVVQEVFRRLKASGDVYAGKYEGWYSVADETFYRDSEVENGKVKEGGAIVERVVEDVYYFRLSTYGDRLLKHIEDNPSFLLPDTRRNEVIQFIKGGLRDIAVSRKNTGWGIEVPDDPSQVIYVWFDALINYLTITGWPDNPGWDKIWPANVHLMAKEIYTRFHATLWPAMLMGLGVPLPEHVLGHGWWLAKGEKISKTKGVNIPSAEDEVKALIEACGVSEEAAIDALRFYLIRDISFTGDAEYSFETLTARYNAYLANDLGNLLNRSLNMLRQYTGSIIPDAAARTVNGPIATLAREVVVEVESHLEALNPSAAIDAAWKLVAGANKEIDTAAPWKLKKEGNDEGVADALYNALEANRIASVLIAPFLPSVAKAIRTQLGMSDPENITWESAKQWGGLIAGARAGEAQPIFPRISISNKDTGKKKMSETQNEVKKEQAPAPQTAPAEAKPAADNLVSIDDVMRLQLRVAEIKTAERIEGAKKLLRLMIDVGEGSLRQLVAGVAESYAPEDLPGRKIVIIANLKPAVIRGVESQGMLLAATDANGGAILLQPDNADTPAGSKVK